MLPEFARTMEKVVYIAAAISATDAAVARYRQARTCTAPSDHRQSLQNETQRNREYLLHDATLATVVSDETANVLSARLPRQRLQFGIVVAQISGN
jgi:hypothetical protein